MERRLAAILAADVVGYTRLMGEDEKGTLQRLTTLREGILEPLIIGRRGRVVKLMGDGLLVEFPSLVDAVDCAVAWQTAVEEHEIEQPEDNRLYFRIGVNLGDVLVEGDDIHGDGVNIAARLEGLAEPGGICLSGDAYRQVRGKIEVDFEDLGEREVKNVAEPLRVYRIATARRSPIAALLAAKPLPLPDKPSIAVLPFTNMSGDPEQEYFSDGISEDIITALSKIPKLFVVARNSTFTYKGRAVDVKQVGHEQGVRYVLEGSVQRSGERLRITAQLIDAVRGHHIWAQRFDRVLQDVFELQDEITREVTSALQVELTEGEQARIWASGTRNYEAWEAVIQIAELMYGHRAADVQKGRHLAQRALQLDENYASAWIWLGWSYFEEAFNGWSEDHAESLDLARNAADRARSIDETNPETFALLAFIQLCRRNFDQAYNFGQKAMALGPNNAFILGIAANVGQYCNRPQDMIPLLKKSMRLCPIYSAWHAEALSWAYLLMGQQDDAIATAQDAVRIDPDYIYSYMVLAVAYAELGRREDAGGAVENILRIAPHYTIRTFAETQPFRDAKVLQRHLDSLRKAGLPE